MEERCGWDFKWEPEMEEDRRYLGTLYNCEIFSNIKKLLFKTLFKRPNHEVQYILFWFCSS